MRRPPNPFSLESKHSVAAQMAMASMPLMNTTMWR